MPSRVRTLLGTAFLSAGGLLLEITFTRVLSVAYFQAYVFIVLSVAVFGTGLGAALATWRPRLRNTHLLHLWSAGAGVGTILLTLLTVLLAGSELRLLLLAISVLPYTLIGLALATVFSSAAEHSPALYWADLGGAGLGVAFATPIMNLIGGLNGMLVAACFLGISVVLLSPRTTLRFSVVIASTVVLVLLGNAGLHWLTVDPGALATPKPIKSQLNSGGKIERAIWNAFALTDLLYRPDQDAYYLYVDGGAGSVVPDASRPELWQRDIGSFPFIAGAPKSVFIIGPGGGLDIALAKAAGVQDITAVEVNAAGIELTKALGDYTGGVYGDDVEILIDEGRSALRRSGKRYDLILLSQVVTQAAEARGYALTENGIYTVEAFHDYLNHLEPEGEVALKLYDELTLTRALITAIQTFRERGLSDAEAARHLMVLLDTSVNPPIPLLRINKQPLDREDAIRSARAAEARGYALLFIPGLLANPPLDALLAGTITIEDLIARSKDANLHPTRDDWPFFYQFEPGLPTALLDLVIGLGIVIFLGLVLLVLAQRKAEGTIVRWAPLLFAALGFGFMAIEITILQRTQLFLGHPTLALSLVLGILLFGGSLGSLLGGGFFKAKPLTGIILAGSLVALLLPGWNISWPLLTDPFLGQQLWFRSSLTALSLLPLAFAMGIPFPLALRVLGTFGERQVALAWSVNGVMSVAGAIGTTVFSILWGFRTALGLGSVAYILVAVMAAWFSRGHSKPGSPVP